MRMWCRVFLIIITLSFVACNKKKELSSPAGLEGASCLQVDSASRYSTAIEGDSIVVTYYANDTVDTTSLHGAEVATEELVTGSKVNYTEQESKTTEQVIIPSEEIMPAEVVETVDAPDTTSLRVESEIDSIKHIDSVEIVSIIDTLDVVDSVEFIDSIELIDSIVSTALVDTVNLIEEHVAIEDSVDESYVARRGMIRRDATKTLFIPKGQWMMGGQLSWKQWDNDNLSYLLLQDLHFSGHTFSVGPYLGYFFAKNMAVGARFSYNRSYLNVDEVGMSLGEGLSFSLNDFYYLQHGYQSSVFLRSYIPIGESKIFGLFGELQLNHSFSEWKCSVGRDDLLQGVYQNTHALELGLAGGLVVFLTDFAAAEVMLNVGGCDYKWGYQNIKEIDKKDEGRLNSSSADFKIDLFSIKFGLTFYL